MVHTSSGSEDLDAGETSSPSDRVFQVPEGDLKPVSGNEQEVTDKLKNTARKSELCLMLLDKTSSVLRNEKPE